MTAHNICQEVLTEINIARTSPSSYADKISLILPYFRGKELHLPGQTILLTNEGPSAVQECIDVLRRSQPLEPLTWSNGLARAAQDHCNDQGPKGKMGHNGSDGSSPADRCKKYGSGDYVGGENIDFGSNVATEIVSHLLIDDGVSSRGHRENILNPRYHLAGVGLGPHKVYRFMCTVDFAGTYTDLVNASNVRNSPQQNRNNSPKAQPSGKMPVSPTNTRVSRTSPDPQPSLKQPVNSNINRPQQNPLIASKASSQNPTVASRPSAPSQSLPAIRQSILEELNLARTNPRAYANHATDLLKYYHGNMFEKPGETRIITQEGASAVQECARVLGSTSPMCRLELSEGLSKASQDHCNDTGPKGKTGHDGTDGSTMGSRIERYGNWERCIGENIGYGSSTAREIVLALLIDDGVSSRGHRDNILNPSYRIVGIGYGPHTRYNYMCTMDFAGGFSDSSHQNNTVEPSYSSANSHQNEENKYLYAEPSNQHQNNSAARNPSLSEGNRINLTDPQQGRKLPNNNPTANNGNKTNKAMTNEEMPEGAISMKTTTETITRNGQVTVKTVKLFTFRDGSTQRVETITQTNSTR